MIDEHAMKAIQDEAANWCLDAKQRGTTRRHAVYATWDQADSTICLGVSAMLEESRGEKDRRTTTVYFPADDPAPIVARTIRARFADPFAEEK